MTDPIADMLTRIRNAQNSRKERVMVPYSKFKYGLAKILEKEGWVSQVTEETKAKFPEISIGLKYETDGQPKIQSIKRVSKPGGRVYVSKDKIPSVLNNYGIAVLSTPRGLMTNKDAKRQKIGGELVCEIF